jgi:hypothetical protein
MRKPKNFIYSTEKKPKKNLTNDQSPQKAFYDGLRKIPTKEKTELQSKHEMTSNWSELEMINKSGMS